MKKIMVILAFAAALALLNSCGEEKVVELAFLQQRGGVYVVPETQKPYSGKFVVTDRKENTVKKAGSLKNGKLHGELTTYREDGSIEEIETFAEDVLNGKYEEYYKNGKIKYAGNYKNKEKNGKWESYGENGKLRLVEHYKDGKEDGKREYYDENGKLITAQPPGSFTDSRDGKKYKTVKIGTQNWMAENLNYESDGSKCYDNKPANCQKYGRLYDWKTALKSCPSGWHLPSDDEWQKLVDIAGGDEAGTELKASSGWNENGNGTDEFGFSALPGGDGYSSGSFSNVGLNGDWWSATEGSASGAYYRRMYHHSSSVGRSFSDKSYLFSVRCAQD